MIKAIVNSGARKIIGDANVEELEPGDTITLTNAYEIVSETFLIPTPEGPIIQPKTLVVGLDGEEESVDIKVRVDNVRKFADMPDRGRKYEIMVSDFEETMKQIRLQRMQMTAAQSMPPEPQGGAPGGSGLIL